MSSWGNLPHHNLRTKINTSDWEKQTIALGSNPVLQQFLQVLWNLATPICLCILYGFFQATMAELSNRQHMVCRVRNIHSLTLYRKFPNPWPKLSSPSAGSTFLCVISTLNSWARESDKPPPIVNTNSECEILMLLVPWSWFLVANNALAQPQDWFWSWTGDKCNE